MRGFVTAALFSLALSPAMAGEAHLDIIHQQCGVQLGLAPAACDCLRNAAAAELNENQQAFMAARVTNDKAEISRIQPLLSQEEAVGVGTFMTGIVARCG